MIELANGHQLDFLVASGALGFNGYGYWWDQPFRWVNLLKPQEFTIITKTLTYEPNKGNFDLFKPWKCFGFFETGFINNIGLTNPGFRNWIKNCKKDFKLIVSIAPKTLVEASIMARELNWVQDIVGIEINASCPNYSTQINFSPIITKFLEYTKHPVIVKLGVQNYVDICTKLDGKIAAFDLINSVPWKLLTDKQPSINGAISGSPIKKYARLALQEAKKITNTPIISGGGIDSFEEVKIRNDLGANAISFGTIFLKRPWIPNQIAKYYRNLND